MGATLTLSRRDADLLIAFTAFFIAFIASRAWRIVCFILHRIYSTPESQETIHHQNQAVLRNSSSPSEAIPLLLNLSWANRSSTKRFRPLLAATIAAFCVSAFTIAGGFSSRISTAMGDEVLLNAVNCGYMVPPALASDLEIYSIYTNYRSGKLDNAANYAQQCYSDDTAGSLSCNRFTKQRIQGTIDANATCPFNNTMCRNDVGNIRLDTGLIDTHESFGLNAPADQRLQWRHVLHCAPLNTEGYTTQDITPVDNFTLYHYGSTVTSGQSLDYVYRAPSVDAQYANILSPDSIVGLADQFVE